MSNTEKNTNTVSSAAEQKNIMKFLTASKKRRRIVRALISNHILFERTTNSLNLLNTVLSGSERGSGFEFEYAYTGIRLACQVIGVTQETEDKIIEKFSDFMSVDFWGKPTKRNHFEEDAKIFYRQLKSLLNDIVVPDEAKPNF